jgi:hypothetical protein
MRISIPELDSIAVMYSLCVVGCIDGRNRDADAGGWKCRRTASQLDVPDTAIEDSNSSEIIRIWIAKKGQHVSLMSGLRDDLPIMG